MVPFTLWSSLRDQAEAGLLQTHLCLTVLLTPLALNASSQVSYVSSPSLYHLHKNPHLRLCFQGTDDLRHPQTHFCVAQGQ